MYGHPEFTARQRSIYGRFLRRHRRYTLTILPRVMQGATRAANAVGRLLQSVFL